MLAVDEGALEREVDETGDDLVLPDRNLAQQQPRARRRLQQLERLAHPPVGLVDLVEEEKARDFQIFQLAQHELQLRHLALVRLAHHHRGVDRRQRGAHLVDELDRTRTVEERIVVAHETGGGDRDLDAHLVMARLLAGVAHRRAGLDRALALDRVGAGEQRFQERGLAALEGPDQCNAPGPSRVRAVVCHCHTSLTVIRDWGSGRLSFQGIGGIGKRRQNGARARGSMRRGRDPLSGRDGASLPMAENTVRQKTRAPKSEPPGNCRAGSVIDDGCRSAQRTKRRSSPATPAAILRPTWPETESGCSATERFEPPTSALAPTPAITDASADPPT